MAESNKILTVSYGTFSCTLEGFDDAFSTMKAIAEYFRDLASEDRYFGAEPPTPDPDMLAQLASRAADRRVQARQSETGIVLRQDGAALNKPAEANAPQAADTASEAPTTEDMVAEDASSDQPVATQTAVADPDAVNAEASEDAAPVATSTQEPDDIPAAPIEAPVEASVDYHDDSQPETEGDAPVEAAESAQTDEEDAAIAVDMTEDDAAPAARLAINRTATVTRPAKPVQAARVQPSRPRVQVSGATRNVRVTTARPSVAPHPDQNSVAAKLQRIRDVVARERAAAVSTYEEDEHSDLGDFDADMTDDDAGFGVTSNVEPAGAMPDVADHEAPEAEAQDEAQDDLSEIDLSAALAIANSTVDDLADDSQTAEDDVAPVETAEAPAQSEPEQIEPEQTDAPEPVAARPVARVLKVKRRDFEAAVRDERIEEATDAPGADDPDADTSAATSSGSVVSSLSPEDEAELQNELMALEAEISRGSRVSSSEADVKLGEVSLAEAAEDHVTASEDLEDDTITEDDFAADEHAEEDAPRSAVEAEADESVFGDEDDAYLDEGFFDTDEVDDESEDDFAYAEDEDEDEDFDVADAEAEAEAEETSEYAGAQSEEEEAADTVNPRSRLLHKADADMDRILAETNNQLGDSDGTRRRSAIAHLRAAVAATKAEKRAGADLSGDNSEEADAYREDLAQVVRPRRPVARGDAPARPSEERPAPLKLVAEQRVDMHGMDRDTPVRPRRVRVADLAEQEASAADMDHEAEAHARAAAAHAASFNEFAERVGAVDLPDLLEAAASYLSFIEGRDQFTRPQLMIKARQALEEEFSREDGLRHFGRLLREGKLRKVASGHFTVSERINFRPEERAVG